MDAITTKDVSSRQKVFEEMKELLSESLNNDKKTFKSLDRIEKLLRTNLAKIQRLYRDSISLGTMREDLTKAGKPEAKVTPVATITPQIIAQPEAPEQVDKKSIYEPETEITVPGKKRKPQKPKPAPAAPPPTGATGLGTVAKVGAVGAAAAVLGGLVGLGFSKKSQLPETEQEAAERGVVLSKENPIFAKKPQGLAQVLDQPEFVAQTRRGKKVEQERKMQEAIETGPPIPTVVRQQQRRLEATQPQDLRTPSEKLSATGYTSIPSRARLQKPEEVKTQADAKVIMIADEPFVEGKELSSKQMAVIEVSKQSGTIYPPKVEEQYAKQKGIASPVPMQQPSKNIIEMKRDGDAETQRRTPDRSSLRSIRAVNQRSAEIQNEVSRSSAENRELSRETLSAPVQPVVIQNNNNMASQNFVPVQAQPRLFSSFSKFQERNSVY